MSLLDRLAADVRRPDALRSVVAVVTAVGDRTVDLSVAGGSVSGIPVATAYAAPVVGDVVLVVKIGSAWLALTGLGDWNPAALPGVVTTTGPLPVGTNGQVLVPDSTAPTGLTWTDLPTWVRNRFSLTSTTPTLALTHHPVEDESMRVELNGIPQDEGADWSRVGTSLSVLAPMGALAGDVLDVHYPQTGPVVVAPSAYVDSVTTSGTTSTATAVNLPPITAGQVLVMAIQDFDRYSAVVTPTGWTFQGHSLNWWANLWVYTRVADGTEGATATVDMGAGAQNFRAVAAIYDASTVQGVAVSSSTDADGTGYSNPDSPSFHQPNVTVTAAPALVVHCTVVAAGVGGTSIDSLGADVAIRQNFPLSGDTAPLAVGDFAVAVAGSSPTEMAHAFTPGCWSAVTLALSN